MKQSVSAIRAASIGRSSKRKGAKAENEVAKLIEEWLRREHPAAVVRRTPLSGGWGAAGEFAMRGDVQVRGAPFPWCVEVKRREGWSMRQFLLGSVASPVWGWWGSICAEAFKAELEPMLWIRQSGSEWIVLLNRAFVASRPRAPMFDYHFPLVGYTPVVGYGVNKLFVSRVSDWKT